MILIFGVQVGQGGKLVEADEPVHTQAQENDNQNTGEYLVQHVTVFDSQQVVAQSFLGADPLSDNSAADTVGGRNLQAGQQRGNGGRDFNEAVCFPSACPIGADQMDILLIHLGEPV